MLYIKDHQAYYYTAQPVGRLLYDLYNFTSMVRTDNAYRDLVDAHFQFRQLQQKSPDAADSFRLVLDFLGNAKTSHLNFLIEQHRLFIESEGLRCTISEEPLHVAVELRLKDLINIIQQDRFQTINSMIATTNCSVWRVYMLDN